MLVLTRRKGEEILIDKGQIRIKVLYERKGVVALGIKAPAHIDVDRKEIFIKKQESPQPIADKDLL
ncbi:MAG: carbon storage regulator [Tatlockia sp.]|nr:carbon storage regulator [Tatlockia sp.]